MKDREAWWAVGLVVAESWTRLGASSLVAQLVKSLPVVRETWVPSLGREDPLEKEMASHSSILAWRIPWMEEPGGLQSTGSQRVGHDWVTFFSFFVVTEQQQHSIADLSFFNTVPGNLTFGYHNYLGSGGLGAQNCVDPLFKDSCFKLPTPSSTWMPLLLTALARIPSFHDLQPTVWPFIHTCVFGKCMVCVTS